MAIVKRLNSNGTWSDIGDTPLKTPVEVVEVDGIQFPEQIVAGDTPVLINFELVKAPQATSVQNTGLSIVVPKAGTYRFKAFGYNPYAVSTSWNYISAIQFYKNDTAQGSYQTIGAYETIVYSKDITCAAGDKITLYASSCESTYTTTVGILTACIAWDNGF